MFSLLQFYFLFRFAKCLIYKEIHSNEIFEKLKQHKINVLFINSLTEGDKLFNDLINRRYDVV